MLEDPKIQKYARCISIFHEDLEDQDDIFHFLPFQQSLRQSWGTQTFISSVPQKEVETVQRKEKFHIAIMNDSDEFNNNPSVSRVEKNGRIDDSQKSSRNKHNIFGYVANSVIRIVMDKYKLKIMRYGKGYGFTFNQFQQTFSSKGNYMYGPEGFKKLFEGNNKKNMNRLFWKLFQKVLRKYYVIYAEGKGKMNSVGPYIEMKNKYLLYIQEYMEQM